MDGAVRAPLQGRCCEYVTASTALQALATRDLNLSRNAIGPLSNNRSTFVFNSQTLVNWSTLAGHFLQLSMGLIWPHTATY